MRISLRLSLIFLFLLLTSNFLVVSLSNLLLPIYGQVWLKITPKAGADQVDTLRPAADRDGTDWYDVPEAGNDWEKIDDTTPDEDATYLWLDKDGANCNQGWAHTDFNTSNAIDSVRMTIRAKSSAISGTPQVRFGREFGDGEGWHECGQYGIGPRTVDLTANWTDYNVTWSVDPCSPFGDPWTASILNDVTCAWWLKSYAVGGDYKYFGQTDGAEVLSEGANYVVLSRFQADYTGDVDSLAMNYSDGNSQSSCKFAIYSDSGVAGYPYICLDSTISASTANGWKKLALTTGVSVDSGAYYWLAFRHSALYDSTLRLPGGPTNCVRYKSNVPYANAWPSPLPGTYSGTTGRKNMIAFTNPAAENQVTQSFVVVYSHAVAGGGKPGKNIMDGGILR